MPNVIPNFGLTRMQVQYTLTIKGMKEILTRTFGRRVSNVPFGSFSYICFSSCRFMLAEIILTSAYALGMGKIIRTPEI